MSSEYEACEFMYILLENCLKSFQIRHSANLIRITWSWFFRHNEKPNLC